MIKPNEDKKLNIQCMCHDPYHLMQIWYSPQREYGHAIFDISFRAFHGSLWERIKEAFSIIFDGWVSSESVNETMDLDAVRSIRDFCDEAILDWPRQYGGPKEEEADHAKG